ncbi:MAG: NUDIX domain-containing protein [Anaerolineae bacterium]
MRYLTVPRTLCFVLHGDDVLLIQRAQHKRLFPGKVNGVGGHVETGEDVAVSAAREIFEETGLEVSDLWLAGVVHVDGRLGQADALPDGTMPGVMVLVYTAQAASRDVRASEEGELLWVPLSQVHGLDWVDGDPKLLLAALAARRTGRPFSLYLPGQS